MEAVYAPGQEKGYSSVIASTSDEARYDGAGGEKGTAIRGEAVG